MDYNQAYEIAQNLKHSIAPACERIEIVGSLKRADKPEVHDIEMLLIPYNRPPVPEFGRPNQVYKNLLEKILADLEYENVLRPAVNKANGERLKRRAIVGSGELNEFCLELFIVNAQTWGIQNVIRTGPALFSHRFVTNQRVKFFSEDLKRMVSGFLPDDLTYVRGETIIKRGEETLSLPEEEDAINVLGHGWIDYADRRKWAMK